MSCMGKEPINIFETSDKREKKPKSPKPKGKNKKGILATILAKIRLL